MSNSQPEPEQKLADVMLGATAPYDALHSELTPHVHEVADSIMGAIRARSESWVPSVLVPTRVLSCGLPWGWNCPSAVVRARTCVPR